MVMVCSGEICMEMSVKVAQAMGRSMGCIGFGTSAL